METLIFKYKGQAMSKRIIGAIWILFGISALLLLSDEPLATTDWVRAIACILIGVIFFTPVTGNNETRLEAAEGNLKIKWRSRIREIIIGENEIEKIILGNKKIEIRIKQKKPVVLLFGEWLWKLADKTKVYEFLIEYARQKNIVLEK
jgi:hypothetical protein